MRLVPALSLAFLLLSAWPAQAMQFRSGEEVDIPEGTTIADDLYVAGGRVRIGGRIQGDLVVGGGDVVVSGQVRDDLLAAGGKVRLLGSTGGSVRAMGGEVRLAGTVAQDAVMAGGTVVQDDDSHVGRDLAMAGGTLEVRGKVGGDLHAAGQELTLSGSCQDASIDVRDLNLRPEARVRGKLSYAAPRPTRLPPGSVSGAVDYEAPLSPGTRVPAYTWWVWLVVASLVTGLILVAALPRAAQRVNGALRAHLGWAIALGFGAVIGGPFFILFALVTVIGIPLGALLSGVYAMGLYLSWLAAALVLGDGILGRLVTLPGPRLRLMAGVALGVLLLLGLQSLPLVGWLIGMIAVFAGFGAIALALANSQGYGLQDDDSVALTGTTESP